MLLKEFSINKIQKVLFPFLAITLLIPLSKCEENPVYYHQIVYLDYTVRYEVTGSIEKSRISYTDKDGQEIDLGEVLLPWDTTFTSNMETYVQCMSASDNIPGWTRINIYVEDEVFVSSSSKNLNYIFAYASGIVKPSQYTKVIKVPY